jgi:autotransporter-associated beta strand protein
VSFSTGDSSLNSAPQNTYSGATALTGGTLTVTGLGGWAAYQSQLLMSGGTTFTANTTPTAGVAPGATFASLSGAGTINLTGGSGNGLDLTGNDQLSTTFSGNITGSAGEFALFGGGGTLTLTGTNNTYSGPTDIFGDAVVGTPGGGPLGATLKAGRDQCVLAQFAGGDVGRRERHPRPQQFRPDDRQPRRQRHGQARLSLSSPSRYNDSLQPFVAVSAAQEFVTAGGMFVTPEVRLGYNREALGGARSLTVASVTGVVFPVVGVRPSKDIVTAGAGLTVDYAPNLALYATYDAIVPTGNTTDQTVQAGLRIRF